jgi:hypothetical protein
MEVHHLEEGVVPRRPVAGEELLHQAEGAGEGELLAAGARDHIRPSAARLAHAVQ